MVVFCRFVLSPTQVMHQESGFQLPRVQVYHTHIKYLPCNSLVPRPHPRGEEKGSGYNTTPRPTLEGRNQHAIVSAHVLTYAMPHDPHCGAYYSNCAVIGHFTCRQLTSLGRVGCRIVTRPPFSGRLGSGHEASFVTALVNPSGSSMTCSSLVWPHPIPQERERFW